MKAIESPLFPFSLNHPFLPTFLVRPLPRVQSVPSYVRPTFHCANLSGHSFPKSPSLPPPMGAPIHLPSCRRPRCRRREIPLHNLSSWSSRGGDRDGRSAPAPAPPPCIECCLIPHDKCTEGRKEGRRKGPSRSLDLRLRPPSSSSPRPRSSVCTTHR